MAQEHDSCDHLWCVRLLVLRTQRYAQGRDSWCIQACHDVQLRQYQSGKLARRHHPVSSPDLLGCSAQCSRRRQHGRRRSVLRTWMPHRNLELGSRVPEQIRVQLHCALRKELYCCRKGYVEDDQGPRYRCAGQRVLDRTGAFHGCDFHRVCLRAIGLPLPHLHIARLQQRWWLYPSCRGVCFRDRSANL